MKPFPESHELIGLFESEPEVADPDVIWFYNRLTFRYHLGEDSIVCVIHPSYLQIDLTLTRGNTEIASFALRQVAGLLVKGALGDECMTVQFSSPELLDFVLWTKPSIKVRWGNADDA